MSDLSQQVRRQLWIGHGCSIALLYGDDGEMQCNCFYPMIDFKRDTEERILAAITDHNQQRYIRVDATKEGE